MKRVIDCPVCKNPNFNGYLHCKDYTVSHETFLLTTCTGCGFVLTNPQPDSDQLGRYYQSPHYISHASQAQGPLDHVYNLARTFTLRWKHNVVLKYSLGPVKTLLDVGCGTGAFLQHCIRKNITVAGVEPVAEARALAIENTHAQIFTDLEQLTHDYDAITLWHVLEHISELNQTIARLKSLLHQNGTMFIAVPNLNSADARKYAQHWAAYDVPRHLWHFTRATITRLMSNHGMKVIQAVPMYLDAYYVSMLSEKYRAGKNGLATITKALVSGFNSNNAARTTQEYSSLIYIVRK